MARASARARAIKVSGGVLAVTLVPAAAAQARTIQVTNLNDSASGTGTLRDAITTADGDNTTASAPDTITFASQLSGSIDLLTPLPALTDSIDIQGPGARVITLNAAGIPNGSGSVISDDFGALTISGLAMNNATDGSGVGGFLDVTYGGAVTLTDDSFSHDTAAAGGAVFDSYHSYGPLTVTGSTFSHDAASNRGGAIYSYASLTISDSTIYDNSALDGGLGAGGSTTITGSTIDDNSAGRNGGGGIDSYNSLTLQDAIVAGNRSADPASDDIRGVFSPRTASYSLIQTAPSNLSVDSSDVTGVSPDLGPLADNGGQTDTQLPLSASPVIDQGKAFGLSTDQRGLARTVIYPAKTAPAGGDHTDIGETELQSVTVSGVSPSSGAPGATVQITGSGFNGATAVDFESAPATSFTVTDDGHITATVPAGSGTQDVRVTTPNGQSAAATSDQFTYLQQSTTSTTATSTTSTTTPTTTATTPTTTTTTSTTATTTAPTTPATTTTPTTPTSPVQPRITGISESATTIAWCQGVGCRYPATSLRFSLDRATTVRLVLRTRAHGHYQQAATTTLHGHPGINHDRIAGRWHGHLVPARPVQILVQIQHNHHWTTTKTIALTVRHTRLQS